MGQTAPGQDHVDVLVTRSLSLFKLNLTPSSGLRGGRCISLSRFPGWPLRSFSDCGSIAVIIGFLRESEQIWLLGVQAVTPELVTS